ncbi:MAG: zinc ribbon domain-containing protein [Bacillota bacterium]|nr:zinc ribbon domain-containing protein [Bacillota bacterium]
MDKYVRTVMLKLYEPSAAKRIILDEAMLNYTKAFQYLLDKAEEDLNIIIDECRKIKEQYRTTYIRKWINANHDKELNKFFIEPFKDSIKIDFAATFCRYINLKIRGNDLKYPSSYVSKKEMEKQYDSIMKKYIDDEIIIYNDDNEINNLITKSEKLRPIFFCRYSSKRNYSLLYNKEKNKYYAKVYLMNVKNDKRVEPKTYKSSNLKYININGEMFNEKPSKRCYLIFPLSFGKWQESYLKEALESPEILKTSRLIKNENEYYLAVNIVKEVPMIQKSSAFMGVSRGINNLINYCIADDSGKIISEGNLNILYYNDSEDKIYKLANSIAEIAFKNRCQVIMEKLIDKGDGLIWEDEDGRNEVPKLSCIKYNQLLNIINYKIIALGLPEVIRVSPVNLFYTCPKCGNHSKKNRFSKELLMCTACGETLNIEKAGSFNLSQRLIKYNNDSIKIKVEETPKGVRFINEDIDFELYPSNPYNCLDEFYEEFERVINNFYINIDIEAKQTNFKKKLSLIKKLQVNKNAFEVIN